MNWCMNCFCMKCTYSNLFFCMPAGCWNSNRLCSDFARPPNLAEGGICNFNYCMIRGLGLSVLFLTGGGANVGGCEWRHGRGGGACAFFWIAWLNSDFLTRSHWFMMKWLSRERSAPWFFSVVHVELHLDVIYRLCFCGQVQSEERQGEHTDASESDGSGYKPPMGPIASKAMPITSKARPTQRPVGAEWPAHLPKPPPPPQWWPFN